MNADEWTIVDTETTTFCQSPVYCIEVAAQNMIGAEPCGEPFRALLNHDVDIDPQSAAIHGYTREFLLRNGNDPKETYRALARYIGERPVFSYNLAYDYSRVLRSEFERCSIDFTLRRGGCLLKIARRTLTEFPSHRLQYLKEQLAPTLVHQAHSAIGDLLTTVDIFRFQIWPRLRNEGATFSHELLAQAWSASEFREEGKEVDWIVDSSSLKGYNVVFTGLLEAAGRSEAERIARMAGAIVQNTVTKKTSMLVAGASPGSKLEKALRYRIPVVSEAEFFALLKP